MASSGQTTVTTAGTEVRLATSQPCKGSVYIKALSTNTGIVYVGNDGADAVSSTSGYPLSAGDQIVLEEIENLNQLWVDASVSGEKVAWLLGKP